MAVAEQVINVFVMYLHAPGEYNCLNRHGHDTRMTAYSQASRRKYKIWFS